MTHTRNVFLVGPMGAGKTTVGQRLAQLLGLEFVDSDAALIERTGVDIATIFDIEGEEGFRDRESRILEELTAHPGIVLATGGGAVTRASNRALLRARGTVIYLTVPLELQLQRTRRDRKRPLLQTTDPRARLERLNRERDPLYREAAHHVVDTGRNDSRRLARDLAAYLHNRTN